MNCMNRITSLVLHTYNDFCHTGLCVSYLHKIVWKYIPEYTIYPGLRLAPIYAIYVAMPYFLFFFSIQLLLYNVRNDCRNVDN